MGGLCSTFAVMCCQSYWWHHTQTNYVFTLKTLETFAWIVPVKLNYQSKAGRQGSKAPSLLKMTPDEISEAAPRSVLWKKLSKFSAILIHKQTYKGGYFQ